MTGGAVVERVQARLVAEGTAAMRAGSERPTSVSTSSRIAELVREEAPLLSADDEASAVAAVVAAVEGLGPLEPLLTDPFVTDVLVNGAGPVWIERGGVLMETGIVVSARETERLIERIVAPLGLRIDRSSPLVDARLPDGSRVHAVVPPLAVDGPCLTIRRFSACPVPLSSFCSEEVVSLLDRAVRAGANVVVTGGTGAGKTTLLNSLAASIPRGCRIVTVEDAAELRLPPTCHVVRLESRPANAEGAGQVTVRELVRNALRMRPDRILVGECRGGEALDMLQAMNTGHEGSMTTCHANGCDDALRRLETMVLFAESGLPLGAVQDQLASAVDLVVHVVRAPSTGRGSSGRRIAMVAEVLSEPGVIGRRLRVLTDGDVVVAEPVRPRVRGESP